ncbi:MAG: phosphopyruvate hydratase [Bacteroidetes bacterium]|nr:phosphopyruvate hydratase [Bacteroidota bacterium]MDA1225412.1 phosphopyruvate hydratase [Bacteroidota bacterium]
MTKIKKIVSRQIFDSRGNPTVETDVITTNNIIGRAAVPSGASTGEHESVELRDELDSYMGKSVFNAVKNVNEIISKELNNLSIFNQKLIDEKMIKLDGTNNKSKLGANAILSVSLAVSKAAANEKSISLFKYLGHSNSNVLPVPLMNIINGGSHSDSPISFQEFMIVPVGAKSFTNALQIGNEVFHNLKSILKSRGLSTAVGDEGGFAPELEGTEDAINIIIDAVHKAGYQMKKDVMIALDCASSEFYKDGYYDYSIFEKNNSSKLNSKDQVEFLVELCKKYPIISIEDGMDENDWEGWKLLTEKIGDKIQLVGDDLFVTDIDRLSKGINEKIANSILIKLNQVGTLSETISSINLASKNNFTSVISHRSGETEDSTIADLCVAFNTGQIKTGSMSRSDRMSKYNQLLRIEEELGDNAKFLGKDAFNLKLS